MMIPSPTLSTTSLGLPARRTAIRPERRRAASSPVPLRPPPAAPVVAPIARAPGLVALACRVGRAPVQGAEVAAALAAFVLVGLARQAALVLLGARGGSGALGRLERRLGAAYLETLERRCRATSGAAGAAAELDAAALWRLGLRRRLGLGLGPTARRPDPDLCRRMRHSSGALLQNAMRQGPQAPQANGAATPRPNVGIYIGQHCLAFRNLHRLPPDSAPHGPGRLAALTAGRPEQRAAFLRLAASGVWDDLANTAAAHAAGHLVHLAGVPMQVHPAGRPQVRIELSPFPHPSGLSFTAEIVTPVAALSHASGAIGQQATRRHCDRMVTRLALELRTRDGTPTLRVGSVTHRNHLAIAAADEPLWDAAAKGRILGG